LTYPHVAIYSVHNQNDTFCTTFVLKNKVTVEFYTFINIGGTIAFAASGALADIRKNSMFLDWP
jgi:hypothetical protein